MKNIPTTVKFWLGGVRIYIALMTPLITLEVWWWAATLFGGTQLEIIRTQEVYAWLSLLFLTLTLLIGPVTKLFPRMPGLPVIRDSRRALGISAAWFAALHMLITYFKQFGGINPLQLPATYQRSMLLGVIALAILIAMAATSVNAIMKKWGVWWFRLHRLVYAAVILVLVHAFMIGAHATTTVVLVILSALALIWIAANIAILIKSNEVTISRVLSISLCIIVLAGTLTYGLDQHFQQEQSAAEAKGHNH